MRRFGAAGRVPVEILHRLVGTTLAVWFLLKATLLVISVVAGDPTAILFPSTRASLTLVLVVVALAHVDVRRAGEIVLMRNLGVGRIVVMTITASSATGLEWAWQLVGRAFA